MKMLEQLQIHPVIPAYVVDDADDDTVATGSYVCMKDFENLLVLVPFADGTATSGDISLEVYQATDTSNSLSDAKVVNCLSTGRIYYKTHATTIAAVGQWTAATQATADEVYTDATSGEKIGMIALEIFASDLDVTNGFDCVRVDMGSVTSAKLVCPLYILGGAKINADPTLMPSVL